MADDNYNDEYHFDDLDAGNVDSTETNKNLEEGSQAFATKQQSGTTHNTTVKRNSLIAVLALVILVVVYPFISSLFSSGKKETTFTSVPPTASDFKAVAKTSTTNTPVAKPIAVARPQTLAPVGSPDNNVSQKLSSLEMTQQHMQTEVVSTNSQLNSMTNTMNDMLAKIAELNRTIALFTAKMDAQSHEIEQLTLRIAPPKKVAVHQTRVNAAAPPLKYYIQAVIPGRAWLIATNGTTLNVREGNVIAGYGAVKLIDPQGRVITSSGRVIRFSQEDS